MSQEQSADIRELLRQGIAAARANRREQARALLMQVVEQDEQNVAAWLWLSGVVDDLEDREICLENVLALDPENAAARRGLAWVRAERAKREPDIPDRGLVPVALPLYAESPPAEERREDVACASAEPSPPADPWDLADPYLCPYCAAPTHEEDVRCPACGNPLWIKSRRREGPSWWLINVMLYQVASTLFLAVIPLVLLTYVAYRVLGRFEPFLLLPIYFGLPGNLPPNVVQAALGILPRAYVLPFFGLSLYSLGMLIGTWLRWQVVFYLLFLGAAVKIALSVAAIAFMRAGSVRWGVAGLVFSLFTILVIFQIEDDLVKRRERLYFALSRYVKGAINQIKYGEMLIERKMWALAVLYLRAGLARMSGHVAGRAALVWAYMQLGRYDLARQALREARQLAPNAPRLVKLAQLLNESPIATQTPG